jgi:hypothetical protein
MKKVTIKTVTTKAEECWKEDREETEVLVDGVLVGSGWYGGEPEDNTASRTYSWVEPLLAALARHLGAEVEYEQVDRLEDD